MSPAESRAGSQVNFNAGSDLKTDFQQAVDDIRSDLTNFLKILMEATHRAPRKVLLWALARALETGKTPGLVLAELWMRGYEAETGEQLGEYAERLAGALSTRPPRDGDPAAPVLTPAELTERVRNLEQTVDGMDSKLDQVLAELKPKGRAVARKKASPKPKKGREK